MMNQEVRKYMAAIGQKGGKLSRRKLDADTARDMVRIREARRAFRRFFTECFWSHDPQYKVTLGDVPWVAEQLMKNGGMEAWKLGAKLCL